MCLVVLRACVVEFFRGERHILQCERGSEVTNLKKYKFIRSKAISTTETQFLAYVNDG